MKVSAALIVLSALFCSTGCSSTAFLRTSADVLTAPVNAVSSLRRDRRVSRILCLWEPAEGQGLDGKPTRGFAGQIMFFSHGDPSPVSVRGTVRIFEYSDFDSEETNPRPIHVFNFDSKAWNVHRVAGTLGETYNVFLPYVETQRKGLVPCALRVEFESEDGRQSSSPYTEVLLTGKAAKKPSSALRRDIVKFSSTGSSGNSEDNGKPTHLESTTIKLPSNR